MERIFRRKLYRKMLQWKEEDDGTKALLIEGARRVGKSTLVEEFAKNEYESYILIDFSEVGDGIKHLFDDLRDLNRLFRGLQLEYNTTLIERKSVIIFDEVQRFPRAREAIKTLVSDGRYDYLETGSLISIKKNIKGIVIPSEEKSITMHPMDFEEFLWACGRTSTYEQLRAYFNDRTELPGELHHSLMKTYREYMAVGGMPQAVEAFVEGKDYRFIDDVKRGIIKLYVDDFKKQDPSGKMGNLFLNIPSELARESHRFMISRVDPSLRSNTGLSRIVEMCDSKTVNICENIFEPGPMMNSSKDAGTFKLYLEDTGLFITACFYSQSFSDNLIYKELISDKLSANLGYVYESAVSQALTASGNKLFYRTWKKQNSTHYYEVDFLVADGTKVIAIEVKSSTSRSHKSLDELILTQKRSISKQYVISQKNLKIEGDLIFIPIYMTGFIRDLND